MFWLLWFDLVEGDGVAECFELALEPLVRCSTRVAPALPVRSELSERDLVADDVVVGHEEVVADCAHCFGLTAPSAELVRAGGECRLSGEADVFSLRQLAAAASAALGPGASQATAAG